MSARTLLFVSHANPEDNEVARWVTLKLASLGYKAWSDVTRLFGGEDFWRDIERVLRNDTVKFLYVLSRTSNSKEGALRELRVADIVAKANKFADFIIPLRIDDLSYGDINIELARLNAIDFREWAAGLRQLEKKLVADGVPKDPRFGPDLVRHWWDSEFRADAEVSAKPEVHYSNWFAVDLPKTIYRYSVIGLLDTEPQWTFPARWHEYRLVTFGTAAEVKAGLGSLQVQAVEPLATADYLSDDSYIRRTDHRNIVTQLLSEAWEQHATARGLKVYEMAGGRHAFYFHLDALPASPNVPFTSVAGTNTYRALMGYRTLSVGKRHWHFAISAKPTLHPQPLISVRTHVMFSDDGRILWSSDDAMHRARRTECKNWWNDDWRDRLLATMAWLSDEGVIRLPLSPSVSASLAARPLEFLSPVTLNEPQPASKIAPENDSDEVTDDEDDEEDFGSGAAGGGGA